MAWSDLQVTVLQQPRPVLPPQILSLDICVATSNFTTESGSASPSALVASLSDGSDSTFIKSSLSPLVKETARFKLQGANAPGDLSAGGITTQVRHGKVPTSGGTDVIDCGMRLYQGGGSTIGAGTLIANRVYSAEGGLTEDDHNLTSGEISAITDWAALYVELDAQKV